MFVLYGFIVILLVMTQKQQIKEFLKTGKSLTGFEALSLFNCFRLPARILELKQEGLNVHREMVLTPRSKKRIAKYYL